MRRLLSCFKKAGPGGGGFIGLLAVLLMAGPHAWAGEGPGGNLKDNLEGYELVGIIEGDTEDSGAIFERKATKKQSLFHIGDEVGDGTLTKITKGAVFVHRGDEVIRIRVGSGTSGGNGIGNPVQLPGEIKDPMKALTKVLSQEIPPYDPGLEKTPVSKKDLSLLIEGIQEGLEDESVWISTPFGSSLSLENFDRDILGRLGLAREDVIVGISGMGFESPDRVSDILSILNRAKVFNFSVLRDKSVLPLYYSVS